MQKKRQKMDKNLGEIFEKKHGSIPLLKVVCNVFSRILLAKGLTTESVLREMFVDEAKKAEKSL